MTSKVVIYSILLLSICALFFSFSAQALAGFLLALSAVACYSWDSRSRSAGIRKQSLLRNLYLFIGAVFLSLVSLLVTRNIHANTINQLPVLAMIDVLTLSISLLAVPVVIWYHFTLRKYAMSRIKLVRKNRSFQPETTPYWAPAPESSKQLRIAV